MANTYKQSFKQNYTDNVEISIYNCGLQSCEAGYTWGPGARDHYLCLLYTSGCNGSALPFEGGRQHYHTSKQKFAR